MGSVISKGTLFPAELSKEIFNKVKGHSSLVKLSQQEGLPFEGKDIFTFSMDNEVSIVGENGAKVNGGATIAPVHMVPLKFEYGTRVSDEFLYTSEERQLEILSSFADGFAKKLGRGLDIAAMHRLNPRTKAVSSLIDANNAFDTAVTANVVTYNAASADTNIDSVIALIEAFEGDVNGIALSPAMRGAIAALTVNGTRKYPEFAFGGIPNTLGVMSLDVNSTVSFNQSKDRAVVGDFRNYFKWGLAKEIPLQIIKYGNPDNDAEAGDLAGHNQVYLRSEAFIGWAIMDPDMFGIVKAE